VEQTIHKVEILGAGESGIGAAILAQKKGYEVFVSDSGSIKKDFKEVLLHHEIPFEENGHTIDRILNSDLIVKSPGIPDEINIIRKARAENIAVISEIEFAGKHTSGTKICVTGSNGKTTTTLLIGHILQKAGLDVCVAGNVGNSFALEVAKKEHDIYVLEISSFQLDGMYEFKADIAVLLNITPDHLDRYENDFQKYIDSKFRIIQNQNAEDSFIYCADDNEIMRELDSRNILAKNYPFSLLRKFNKGGYLDVPLTKHKRYTINDLEKINIIIQTNTEPLKMTIDNLALQGRHNIYNSMAASIASRVLDLRKDVIKESLSDFQNIEHRLEYVAKVHGIEFINDSKATNINSTWYALESMNKPVIWIAGGIDKGNDYELLLELVKDKVEAIVCLGLDNSKIKKAFKDHVDTVEEAVNAKAAVDLAYGLAKPGEVVLLSPACASFDLFKNYEDRGLKFKNAVKTL